MSYILQSEPEFLYYLNNKNSQYFYCKIENMQASNFQKMDTISETGRT